MTLDWVPDADQDPPTDMADIAAATVYAVDNGADAILMGFGGMEPVAVIEDAIQYADANDVPVVASAGNDSLNTDQVAHYPSSYLANNIIVASSSDHNDQIQSTANYGVSSVDLVAPGANLVFGWNRPLIGLRIKPSKPVSVARGSLAMVDALKAMMGIFFVSGFCLRIFVALYPSMLGMRISVKIRSDPIAGDVIDNHNTSRFESNSSCAKMSSARRPSVA